MTFPLAALTVVSACGSVVAPHLLVSNPLLLIALSPRTVYLVVAADAVPVPLFLVVGLLRLAAADPWYYALGRLHGPAMASGAARWSPRAGRLVGRLLDLSRGKCLVAVAFSPTGKVLALAGASGLRPGRVALADAGGTLAQLAVLYAFGRPLVRALNPSSLTLAIVAIAVAVLAVAGPAAVSVSTRRRARARRLDALATMTPGALGA